MIDFGRGAIEFDDQQSLDIERVADIDESLGGVDRRPVHHLHPTRNDAGSDHRGNAIAGILGRGEPDQQRARRRRLRQDTHRDLGHDPQQPLGTGHHAQQIVAFGVEMLAAEPDDLAIHQHQLDAEDVVGGQPVFEAMHAAGIFGDIAADRAGDLARRIGRVIKAGMLDRLGQCQIGHPGLSHHAAIVVIDLEDAVELGHAEQYAVGQRQCPARKRGAGAARHHLDADLLAIAQDRRDLFDPRREHHDQWQLAISGQPVALIGAPLGLRDDDAFARHDLAQAPR